MSPVSNDPSPREPQGPPSVQPDVDLDSVSPTVGNRLAVGLRLHEYEISGVIGEGGFGIVYLAWDHSLQRRVAIKEYMPAALARRGVGTEVEVFDEASEAAFHAGLRSFVNEAKLLARFDHPSLLKVHRFWQANGTAYMVMPLYEGATLKEALAARGEAPDEAWLRALLAPLLDALAYLHAQSCYHRDIAPDNIMLLEDGRPLLLDFGAARRLIGDMNKAVTVILKSGYAPIEQYGETPGLTQGPWTDIYALGAVLHFALTGKVPKASVSRMLGEQTPPLAQRLEGRCSATFLAAVDRMLAVQPSDRPQSIAELRAALEPPRGGPARGRSGTHATPAAWPAADPPGERRRWWFAAAGVLAAAGIAWGVWSRQPPGPVTPPAGATSVAPQPTALPAAPLAAPIAVPPASPAPSAVTVIAPPAATPANPPPEPSGQRPVARDIAAPPAAAVPARAAPVANPPPARRRTADGARCADIVQRVSLGEALSEADRRLLAEECRQ